MADDPDFRKRYRHDYAADLIARRPAAPKPQPEVVNEVTPPAPAPPPAAQAPVAPPQQTETAAPPISVPDYYKLAKPRKPKLPGRSKKKKAALFVLTPLLLVAIGVSAAYLSLGIKPGPAKPQYPATITRQVKTALYYPVNLPDGYSVSNDFKVNKQNSFYYTIKGPNGSSFYITSQPFPAGASYQSFEAQVDNQTQYKANIGNLIVGDLNNNLIGSILTSKGVWILISSQDKNSQSQINDIAASFAESR